MEQEVEIGVRENRKLDESCISNSKLEISDWTDYRADRPVQFEISSFEFEMQDSSNFRFFRAPEFPRPDSLFTKSLRWRLPVFRGRRRQYSAW